MGPARVRGRGLGDGATDRVGEVEGDGAERCSAASQLAGDPVHVHAGAGRLHASRPRASSAPISPARQSPVPAVARAGPPLTAIATRSAPATTLPSPLSTTTAPVAAAIARAAATRSPCTSARSTVHLSAGQQPRRLGRMRGEHARAADLRAGDLASADASHTAGRGSTAIELRQPAALLRPRQPRDRPPAPSRPAPADPPRPRHHQLRAQRDQLRLHLRDRR
jgi:hypothetical protein